MYAVFNDNLLTGNNLIDEQHREIIEKINKLVNTCENGSCQIESPSQKFVKAVQENVIDWLYRHIKGFDCSVAAYINMAHLPERL